MDNPNRGMQGGPETVDHFTFVCCLASAFRISSCLGVVLLSFPCDPGSLSIHSTWGLGAGKEISVEDDP